MSHAENVQKVYALMADLKIDIYDLELFGQVESADGLRVSVAEAFDTLIEAGFTLGADRHTQEHYHQATADYVGQTLAEHRLVRPDHAFEEFDGEADVRGHLADEHDYAEADFEGKNWADLIELHRDEHRDDDYLDCYCNPAEGHTRPCLLADANV